MQAFFGACALALCAGEAMAQNLAANAGFEQMDNAQPRAWMADVSQTLAKLSIETGAAARGRSARIENSAPTDRGSWRQQVAAPAPGFYVAAARYRTMGVRPGYGSGAVLRVLREGDRAVSVPAAPSTRWTSVSQVFYAKPGTRSFTLELANQSGPGTVWWDDVSLRRATAAEVEAFVRSRLDAPPVGFQVSYAPAEGSRASVNPPAFVWLPVDGAAKYVVEISRSADFPRGQTIAEESGMSLQVLRRQLDAGKWHWRYGVVAQAGAAPQYSRARAFEMPADAVSMPFPDVRELVRRISGSRPRVGILASELAGVRERARGDMQWAVKSVVAAAEDAIGKPLLPEPERLPPPNHPKRGELYQQTFRTTRPFLHGMDVSAEAYLLTGDERFGQEARRRLMHVLAWDPNGSTSLPLNDEPGTELVRLCPRAYDYIYPLLSDAERRKAREVLAIRIPQVYAALRARPFESNPYESHAMDYYISDLTESCLRMAGDLPVEEMLEYVLSQIWAPFYPPYGGEDGGWSEGPSYWGWSTLNFVRIFRYVEQVTGRAGLPARMAAEHAVLQALRQPALQPHVAFRRRPEQRDAGHAGHHVLSRRRSARPLCAVVLAGASAPHPPAGHHGLHVSPGRFEAEAARRPAAGAAVCRRGARHHAFGARGRPAQRPVHDAQQPLWRHQPRLRRPERFRAARLRRAAGHRLRLLRLLRQPAPPRVDLADQGIQLDHRGRRRASDAQPWSRRAASPASPPMTTRTTPWATPAWPTRAG